MIWHRSDNEFCESSDTEDSDVDFERPVNQAKEEENEGWGLPPDLRRMVEQEEREVKPHQEETEVMNLGTSGEKKEAKIDTCVFVNVQDELVALLQDYQDIFAWAYKDMAICDINMCFTFVSAGWEGSAYDTKILMEALRKSALHFPHPPQGT